MCVCFLLGCLFIYCETPSETPSVGASEKTSVELSVGVSETTSEMVSETTSETLVRIVKYINKRYYLVFISSRYVRM